MPSTTEPLDHRMSVSAVVPVYCSEKTLAELVSRLVQALGSCSSYEILLVNDGSSDGSWREITRLAAAHPHVRGLNLLRNFGQHNALLAGIRAATKDVVVTLDDDLQNPPEEIGKLLAPIAEGCDVVYGTPVKVRQDAWRRFGSWLIRSALRVTTGMRAASNVSSFRAFRTELRQAFAAFDDNFVSIDVLLSWGARRFGFAEVRHDPRRVGRSNYRLYKLMNHAVDLVTGFSVVPLRLASMLGFAITLFGVMVLFYVVGRYLLEGSSVAGFPFLASIIAIFSGAQLFALGIIGEYLGRMHFRLMARPCYVVKETAAHGQDAKKAA